MTKFTNFPKFSLIQESPPKWEGFAYTISLGNPITFSYTP